MWYREGTVTFTKGSDTISGIGTRWNLTENGVLPGMIVIGPDNKLYEVKRVTSDTVIVLSEPYTGETQSKVPCRIITTYEGDLTQFSARFTALMSRMSADSKSMRSWLTALDDVTIEREDGTEVTVKPLMQIVNEHNENVEWYKNNTDAIEAAGDKAREAAASAVAAAESANTAVEKASQASQSASAAVSSQSAASESAAAAEKSETNAEAAKEAAAESASVASTKASEAATSASSASASKDAAKLSETNASSSANAAASSATEAANSCKAAKASETNAKASEAAAEQSALSANSSKSAAETSASAASVSADSASSSATSAEKSAESASLSAANATAKATEATKQATAAEKSAEAAKSSETNAKTSEDNAAASKETAAESASSASVSASSASSSKDEAARQASAAAESATTASTKATEAADSATEAAQSKNAAESAATRSETAAKRAEDIASAVALEDASTTKKGVVQLSSATNSTSETLAATPKAVKAAYDLANGKYTAQDATTAQKGIIQLSSATNSTSETLAATPKAVKAANDNAEKRLQKDQNGADIPGKDTFTKNIGACRAFGGSVSTTTGNWTTAQFIEWLDSQGAFNHPYWMCKGSWSYGNNKIITDTDCGNIHLAGAVIEVMGIKSAMTIRITTPTTSTGGGTTNAQFTYINHGTDYSPGWRRDYNSRNKPTASEIGALPSGGTAVSSVNLASKGRVLHRQIFRQASWLFSTVMRHRGISLKIIGEKPSMTWLPATRYLFLNSVRYRKMLPGYHRMGNIRSGTAHPGRRMRKQKNCFRYGNLDKGAPWQGLVNNSSEPRFCTFKDPVWGIRALAVTLITYHDKRRAKDGSSIDTIREVIERWAPPHENNTLAYVNEVSKAVGVAPDMIIDLHDYETLRPLVEAIIRHENGRGPLKTPNSWYTPELIEEGLRRAGIVKPVKAVKAVPVTKETAGATVTAGIGLAQIADVMPQVSAAMDKAQGNISSGDTVRIIFGVATILVAAFIAWSQVRKHQNGMV